MTDEKDLRLNAAIAELISQRDMAQARCANLAGDLAAAQALLSKVQAALAGAKQTPPAEPATPAA